MHVLTLVAVTVGVTRSQTLPRKLALSRYQLKRSLADLQDEGGHTQGDTATDDDEDPSRGDDRAAATKKEETDSETNVATAAGGAVVAAIISFFFAATACLLGRRRAADTDEPVVGSPLARAVKGVLERLDALAAEHQRVMRALLVVSVETSLGRCQSNTTPAGALTKPRALLFVTTSKKTPSPYYYCYDQTDFLVIS